jgi:hypothetical protein
VEHKKAVRQNEGEKAHNVSGCSGACMDAEAKKWTRGEQDEIMMAVSTRANQTRGRMTVLGVG